MRLSTLEPRTPLLLATTIAGGTLVYADPVRYDNDGSFQWTDGIHLDLTRPVSKQTGTPTSPGSFLYFRRPSIFYGLDDVVLQGATTDADIEGRPIATVQDSGAVVPGDFVSSYGQWFTSTQALGYYYADGAGFYTQFDLKSSGTPGDPGYIAARFTTIDNNTHYGWISLRINTYVGPRPHYVFELLAWGYETDPDTPIEAGAVPAPASALALLAFGAAAGATRGRRA